MGGENCTVLGLRLMHKLAMSHTASSFSRPVTRPHSYSQQSINDLACKQSLLAENSSGATSDYVQLPADSTWRHEYSRTAEKLLSAQNIE